MIKIRNKFIYPNLLTKILCIFTTCYISKSLIFHDIFLFLPTGSSLYKNNNNIPPFSK